MSGFREIGLMELGGGKNQKKETTMSCSGMLRERNYFKSDRFIWVAVLFVSGLARVGFSQYIKYSNPNRYHVRQTACSYNKNITTMDSLELNVSLPESWPDCKVTHIDVQGNRPFMLHNTEGPGQICRTYFQNRQPSKGETVYVGVDYDVELYQVDIDLDALSQRSFLPVEKNAETDYYLRPDPNLKPDDMEVRSIIQECKLKARGNHVLYAKAVYDWVGQNIKYGPQPSGGPKAWLRERTGDCGAIASIFVALCRGGGVPARFIAGFWAGGIDGWHCWAEFYVPKVGWIPIDHSPAGGFGHLSNNHLPLVKAGEMKFDVRPGQGGNSAGFVQFGYWFFWFGGGGEGGDIYTEFAVESFAYDEMPRTDSVLASTQAQKCFLKADYNRAIQIYRRLLRLKSLGEKRKNLVHIQLAKCYLKKNQRVKAALELLPVIENSANDLAAGKMADTLLKAIRREEIDVSALNIERIRQGWGAAQRDRSVDHKKISIGGKKFERGIGTHAESVCVIETNGAAEEFSAEVGVDDEIGTRGSVEFLVFGDETLLWRSGLMKGGRLPRKVNVKLDGVKKLTLKVTDGGDGCECDHADWANPKLRITGRYPSIVP